MNHDKASLLHAGNTFGFGGRTEEARCKSIWKQGKEGHEALLQNEEVMRELQFKEHQVQRQLNMANEKTERLNYRILSYL